MNRVLPFANRLFAWNPDRRTVRWDSAPFDDNGEDLILFDGCDRDPGLCINLEIPRKGKITDLLYSPLLLLFVSDRVRILLDEFNTASVTAHQCVLRDREGRVVDDSYWWMNCHRRAKVLDMEKAKVRVSEHGTVEHIESFVVLPDAVPGDDLFMCDRSNLRIFKERLVEAIRKAGFKGASFELLEGKRYPV